MIIESKIYYENNKWNLKYTDYFKEFDEENTFIERFDTKEKAEKRLRELKYSLRVI